MSEIIKNIEKKYMKKDLVHINSGDLVEVKTWVIEGNKKRLQSFEGIVISIRKRGINSSFTVRKISNNEGIERVFQTHSPVISTILLKRHSFVRRAKLYYLRKLTGKASRMRERFI